MVKKIMQCEKTAFDVSYKKKLMAEYAEVVN